MKSFRRNISTSREGVEKSADVHGVDAEIREKDGENVRRSENAKENRYVRQNVFARGENWLVRVVFRRMVVFVCVRLWNREDE